MPLTGSVETLSLLELFEIIHEGRYSGTLRLSRDGAERVLLFSEGALCVPEHEGEESCRLGGLLVREGGLTEDGLRAGLAAQRERGGRIGEVLASLELVSPERVEAAVTRQTEEAVYDLFLWRGARFTFEKGAPPPELAWDIEAGRTRRLDLPSIAMEAARRIDEWRRIEAAIRTPKAFFRARPERRAAVAAALAELGVEPDAVPFDGRRSLIDMMPASGLTAFELCGAVLRLLEAGHLEPMPPARLRRRVHRLILRGRAAEATRSYEALLEGAPAGPAGDDPDLDAFVLRRPQPMAARTSGRRALQVLLTLIAERVGGRVRIAEPGRERILHLTDGHLAVASQGPSGTPAITHFIRRRGVVAAEALEAARAEARRARRQLHSVLLQRGLLTEADWLRVLTDKVIDEVLDVFFWESPSIEVVPEPGDGAEVEPPSSRLRLTMPWSAPSFSADLADELAQARRCLAAVPSVRVVLAPGRPHARPDLQKVLRLFDGRRSLAAVAREVESSRRDLLRFVAGAVRAGYLRPLTAEGYAEGIEEARAAGWPRVAEALCRSAIDCGVDPERHERALRALEGSAQADVLAVLEGDFESLSFAEILQSLQRKQQTGTLRISDGRRTKVVHFHQGDLYLLRSDEETSEFAGDFLDDDALSVVEEAFGGDLVAKGYVTEDELSEAEALEIKEELWRMFLWEGARFQFIQNLLPPEFYAPGAGVTRLSLRTDLFLLEAVRRIVAWDELRGGVGGPERVYRFASFEAKMQALTERGSPEVLYLLDGRHTLDEVIRKSGRDRVEVYRLLAELRAEGALEALAPAGDAEDLRGQPA